MSEYSTAKVELEHWERELSNLKDQLRGASDEVRIELERKIQHAEDRIERTETTISNLGGSRCPNCGRYH